MHSIPLPDRDIVLGDGRRLRLASPAERMRRLLAIRKCNPDCRALRFWQGPDGLQVLATHEIEDGERLHVSMSYQPAELGRMPSNHDLRLLAAAFFPETPHPFEVPFETDPLIRHLVQGPLSDEHRAVLVR